MTQYFLDSSALIKRYIVEPGTTWVRSIIQRSSGNTVIIAQITQIEIVSGASRRVRRAEDLLTVHPLRTYDAVQLASALESNTRLVAAGLSPVIFVSADVRLLVAATTEGLMAEDPNAHP